METPSSTRRVTRSQTSAAASANNANSLLSRKLEESEKVAMKSRQKSSAKKQQKALIDITNDSPIVGLAMGNLETPSSAMSKKRISSQGQSARTPGSGEALLRGQVKTLLQKVEEEAELSKITLENRAFFNLQGVVSSPMNLLAPTPANTPQVLNFSASTDSLPSVTEKILIPQMVNGMFDKEVEKKEEVISESENPITRSLLLDFSEKSERSDSSECSVLTYQGAIHGDVSETSGGRLPTDDDDESVWSIQVNASSTRDDDEEEDEVENYYVEEDYYEAEEEQGLGDNDGLLLDDLCEGIRKISVKEGLKFSGKHIRFVYNSEGELQGEEQVCGGDQSEESSDASSPSPLRLKGLPTPKGKHVRFPQE